MRTDVHHDVSLPLGDLVKTAPAPEPGAPKEAEELRHITLFPGFKPPEQPDPVLQGAGAVTRASQAATILKNFDGIGQGVPPGFNINVAPPDTNGTVGLTQYVQWVNTNFAVFDKATGAMLPNFPVPGNTLWKGFGGSCEKNNDGDPIVLYDKLADRWVFSQLVVFGTVGFGPFFQCVAVSTTSDALGTYNRYSFPYSTFDDYPKMGVWPDAYYETFNMFDANGSAFLGADACAYDRNAMLNGQPATQICFQQGPSVGGLLPSDLDGHTPPPAGSPNFLVFFDVNSLKLFKFHVDFATPANSTFTGPTAIPVAPFTPLCFGGSFCVPQSTTGTQLDSLADRLMNRLAYRNFGDHESLVVNHAVAVGPSAFSGSGVRWYELQNPNGAVTVAQQSTFAPDITQFRWMGSIAMDHAGDIAMGYSVSSSNIFPSIAIAAREASDPPSTMQAETSIITGGGSQLGLDRWGDYSAMQVDPVDDCTFWYTTEYLKNSGAFNWNTRIASFKFTNCDKPDMTVTSTHSGDFTQGQTGKTYTLTAKNSGGKASDGTTVTVTDTLPTGLTATAISGTGWTCTLGTLTCTRTDVLASGASYPDITLTASVSNTAPGLITNNAIVAGGGEVNLSNDSASDPTTIIQLGPDPTIAKTHAGNFVHNQTATYTITVTNVGLSPLDGTPVTVTDTLPTGLTASAASGIGWTCLLGPPVSCTRTDALASNTPYPPITLTVNVASNAPPSVINTATVSGGGNVNTFNDTATDPTTVVPGPPDLTITKIHSGNFNQGQFGATYTLTVSNAVGDLATSSQVTVSDTLPTGLTTVSASGLGWFCFFNGATVTCLNGNALDGGSSYPPISLSVNVANNAPASVINTATVSGGGDVSPGNNTATDPTTINPSPDLTITKTHSPDPFVVGQTGLYTLTVSNVGNAPTSGAVNVNDLMPQGLIVTAVNGTGWTCPSSLPTAAVNCTRSDVLATGSSYPAIVLTVSVNGGGPGVTNSASVNGGGEFNGANNFANDFTSISAPFLTIAKSHTGNFTVGLTGNYTITVGNIGPIATIGTPITVSDNLPLGLTATAVSGLGWTCSGSTSVTCTRSDALAANSSYPPITLTATVDGNAAATVFNSATVTGGGDSNIHFIQDPTTVNVPDLAITKTHSGNFTVGQTGAVYTITVSNVGTVATAGGTVNVLDFLPFGLTATAASGTGWTCSIGTGFLVNCTQPASILAPGSSYPPITLTVNVTAFNAFPITNTASVSGIGDANLGNNSTSDTTTVVPAIGITPTSPTTVTVTGGTAATFTTMVNLATNPAVGTVTFSARAFGIFPPNAKVTFNPPSLTASGPVTMTVDTSGNGHVASLAPGFGRATILYAALFFPLFGLLALRWRKQIGSRSWLGAGMCVCGLALLLAFSGCGGGSSPPPPPPPPPVITPPGTYSVTMTGTSSNVSVQQTDMTITLVVK